MKLKLTRPLVFFDLETTGLNIASDRIVELSYYKVFPDGSSEGKTFRIKPTCMMLGQEIQMHIAPDASAVHGIYDEDLENCPTFREIAPQVVAALEGADLAGYNSNHFDLPLLAEELMRVGADVDLKAKRMVDVFTIFQRQEPRTLVAAYKFYCGKDLTNAHAADADTMATYEVLMAQLERYDLPEDVNGLADYTTGNVRFADFAGRIAYDADGVEIFNFGKYKGQRVADVFRRDSGYYGWIQNGDFPQYTKGVFTRIYLSLRG
ncbi:MAG: 3'-5' exonuclease [Paludibacteraceae bacterium]|jgi:DNA polymerase-3 subunit epsilon|nr:3'-5' exonuclease [Paludibacteraceae bacterium]